MSKIQIMTEKAPGAIGPYSQGIIAGGTVYLSGQIPIDPATGDIAQSIAAQARQVLDNISAILNSINLSMENVIKTTVFIKNMDDFATVNEIYGSYFHAPYPARSCVEVARLPKDVLVEIEVVAAK